MLQSRTRWASTFTRVYTYMLSLSHCRDVNKKLILKHEFEDKYDKNNTVNEEVLIIKFRME